MKGQPVTQNNSPARRSSPLRGFVIAVVIMLVIPTTREIIFSGFWYVFGTTLGVIIGLFLFAGGTRVPRR